MTKNIEFTCQECQSTFEKSASEYRRTSKRGYRQFCSRACGNEYKKKHGSEFVGHLDWWVKSDANKKHALSIQQAGARARWGEQDSFREFLRRARKSVTRKGLDLDLTLDDIKVVWNNQRGKCPYTGWDLELPKSTSKKKHNTASLDRINSSRGYVVDNIQIVCVMANFAKSDFDEEIMQKFCHAIKLHAPSV